MQAATTTQLDARIKALEPRPRRRAVIHRSISERVRSLRQVSDRRGCARLALEVPVRYAVKGQRTPTDAVLGDISSGGVFIRTQTPPAVGQTVACGFLVDGDPERVVAMRGRVAWRRTPDSEGEAGFGVRVVLAMPEHRDRIEALVAAAAPPALTPDL